MLFADDPGFPGLPDDFIQRGPAGIEAAAAALEHGKPIADIQQFACLPPFRRAGKILCVGLNFAAHAKEAGMATPDYPTVFARFNSGLVGHGQPLIRPRSSDQFDYESELAFIIGRRARYVSEESALDHVAGYSILNDGSIRDVQLRTPQWTIGKNFDGTGGFGPDFITADELPPGCEGLRMQGRHNGDVVQDTSLSDMIFGVKKLVAILSAAMTLEPGDVVATGTPSGVGLSFKPPRFLKPGDIFEVEIEKIGVLRNPVVAEA
ncbi:fumarylacetoacetate hydrolase family protein [Bradyrhizobium oligotrophicum]|uniref:fumarylacetoacetate hydrolase family protein n=1 Tax=Bradyrhizobium oligotrophicum TaxID=44255 RepID=UPI003EBDF902